MPSARTKKVRYSGPVGDIFCIFEGNSLIKVSIMARNASNEGTNRSLPGTHHFSRELRAYFQGKHEGFRQKIKFTKGTVFEQKVWTALKGIPYGETRSYKWMAERVGSPKAVRAVGQALKKNPLPIVLPCHRVIASDGSIGGFACGVEIKKWLLTHEQAVHKKLKK